MRRIIGLVVAALLAAASIGAFPSSGKYAGVASIPYAGPGDVASGAFFFHSCGRAYSAAYAASGGAACDVVDTATGLITCTMHFLSTGFVNKTECSGVGQSCQTACSVAKEYDQTGNGNYGSQATLADMPALAFNAQNGLPCLAGTNTTAVALASPSGITQSLPFTVAAVAERTGNFSTTQRIVSGGSSATGNLLFVTANSIRVNNGAAVTLTAADSAPHAIITVASATAPYFAIDSNSNSSTTSSGTSPYSDAELVDMNSSALSSGMLTGLVCETEGWPSDQNANAAALLSNMRSSTVGWNF